ncbi:hypothetical protein Poli38472_005393 [Pythium oligandrum]|uniref:Uncharacterized protein n=1 Tax=Pythium oligandrum TaxID=41045 RepID=A0A8K1FGH4_PYTOL|nr:hypothetical protein Poli38472_005393 [Pythium oligandrum]|eukprot:TMW62775.1 hypothetical protein Poli38472_005393 [Pythium oligandrum]
MQALEDPVKLFEVDKQNGMENEVLDYDQDDVSLLKTGISSETEQTDVHDLSSCSSNETMGATVASESVVLLNDRPSEEADLEPIVSTFQVVDTLNSTSIEAPGHEDIPKNESSVRGDSDAVSHGEESERATEESELPDRSIVEPVEVVESTLTTGGPLFEVAAVKDIQNVDTEDTRRAIGQSLPSEEQEKSPSGESGHAMETMLNAEDAQDIDDERAATGVVDPADQGITSEPQETPPANELADAVEATDLSSAESDAESEEDAPEDTRCPTIELLKSVETGPVSAPETTDITSADLVEGTTTTEALHSEGDGATQRQLSSVDLASASVDANLPQLTELLLAAIPALQERSNPTKIELVHYPTLKQLDLPAEVDDDNDNYATDFEDNDHREDDTDDSQGYESFDDE